MISTLGNDFLPDVKRNVGDLQAVDLAHQQGDPQRRGLRRFVHAVRGHRDLRILRARDFHRLKITRQRSAAHQLRRADRARAACRRSRSNGGAGSAPGQGTTPPANIDQRRPGSARTARSTRHPSRNEFGHVCRHIRAFMVTFRRKNRGGDSGCRRPKPMSSFGDGSRLPTCVASRRPSATGHTAVRRSASVRTASADKYSARGCACVSAEPDSCIRAAAARPS